MKTEELIGPTLDWAVAKCLIENPIPEFDYFFIKNHGNGYGHYSTDWAQGGPIIERERIELRDDGDGWMALDGNGDAQFGPAPLIAAMRCYVASKLGDEVEIPEELK